MTPGRAAQSPHEQPRPRRGDFMKCPRCHNLVVPEEFLQYESDRPHMACSGYECMLCGGGLDTTILSQRARGFRLVHLTKQRRSTIYFPKGARV